MRNATASARTLASSALIVPSSINRQKTVNSDSEVPLSFERSRHKCNNCVVNSRDESESTFPYFHAVRALTSRALTSSGDKSCAGRCKRDAFLTVVSA